MGAVQRCAVTSLLCGLVDAELSFAGAASSQNDQRSEFGAACIRGEIMVEHTNKDDCL